VRTRLAGRGKKKRDKRGKKKETDPGKGRPAGSLLILPCRKKKKKEKDTTALFHLDEKKGLPLRPFLGLKRKGGKYYERKEERRTITFQRKKNPREIMKRFIRTRPHFRVEGSKLKKRGKSSKPLKKEKSPLSSSQEEV